MSDGFTRLRGPFTARTFFDTVSALCDEFVTINNYDRAPHAEIPELQTVTGGNKPLKLHCEMGHTPGRPDIIAFWCEAPSASGGETLACDGVALLRSLSAPTRSLFERKRLLYKMRVPRAWWTARINGATLADAQWALEGTTGPRDALSLSLDPHGTLSIDWLTPGIFLPNTGDELCLCSNFFADELPGLVVSFEDGAPLPLAELADVVSQNTRVIDWRPGEVVLLDNTRWLHGRRVVGDPERRKVHTLMAYLRESARNKRMRVLPRGA